MPSDLLAEQTGPRDLLSDIQTPADTSELSFRQGVEPDFIDEVFSFFRDPEKEKAKAFNAVVTAEDMTKEIQKRDPNAKRVSPSFAYSNADALKKHYEIDPERKARVEDSIKK